MSHQQNKIIIAVCCLCGFLLGCGVSGQIGDIYSFHTPKAKLDAAIDSLYAQYPEYKMPAKWEKYNNLSLQTAPYLETKIFYFKTNPEEMYYVSLIDDSVMSQDSSRSGLAIKAINRGSDKWLFEGDMDFKQVKQVQKRFEKEIVSRLEKYTNTKVTMDD